MVCEYNEEETIVYIYDANGSPIGFKYRSTWHEEDVWEVYWYEKNLQGDIVSIYDEYGNLLVTYTYNAWGRKGEQYYNGADSTAAVKNNLRYRSYYYDPDLEMYYLQSRYYDYKICRFINADAYVSTGQGLLSYNMFAYCENNPVMYIDDTGEFPWLALIVITLSTIAGGVVGNIVANKVEAERNEALLNGNSEDLIIDEPVAFDSNGNYNMPASERAKYIVTGAIIGTAVGGTLVSVSGVIGSFAVRSVTTSIRVFGNMNALQMYALGALVRNLSFYVITPFIDIGEANEEFFEVPGKI